MMQRSELETLLAMERAARAAVEKATATISRSNISTPLHTPLRTVDRRASRNGTHRRDCLVPPSLLLEQNTPDVMGRHRTDVLTYSSPDGRGRSPFRLSSRTVLSANIRMRGQRENRAGFHREGSVISGGGRYHDDEDFSELSQISDGISHFDEPEQLLM